MRDGWQQFTETLFKLRHPAVVSARRLFMESQWWDRNRMEEYRAEKVVRLVRHAWDNVPFQRRRMEAAGLTPADIRQPADLKKLPAVTKAEVKKAYEAGLATVSWRELRPALVRSSGSTGQSIELYRDRGSREVVRALLLRVYSWGGIPSDSMLPKVASLWGRPATLSWAQRLEKEVRFRLNNVVQFNTHGWSERQYVECLYKLVRMRPDVVTGYAFALAMLARVALSRDDLKLRPAVVVPTAHTLLDGDRQVIEKAFETRLLDRYGGAECEMIAAECDTHDCYHLQDEHVVVDLEETQEGERSLRKIVVTDLDNYAMPFIRYEMGDLAEPFVGECRCGRVLGAIRRVVGRVEEVIHTEDGRVFSVHSFNGVLRVFPWVEQFQVIQEATNKIRVKLVTGGTATRHELELAKARLAILFKGLDVTVERVDSIRPGKSGKVQVVVPLGGD